MRLKKVIIENYKQFYGKFDLFLKPGTNIIVGDNESGKTTIIEAIELALSGLINGRFVRFELNQYIFNNQIVKEYLDSLVSDNPISPPQISIEVFFETNLSSKLEGSNNSTKEKEIGFTFTIGFSDRYAEEYEKLVQNGDVKSLPIEYYDVEWKTFAREEITPKQIPVKSALIDSTINRGNTNTDIYISKILRENLETSEIVEVSQAYRRMKDSFSAEEIIKKINDKVLSSSDISSKRVTIAIDLEHRNAWESALLTYLDDIPFDNIGKGEQCIVKTNLALITKKAVIASILLIEEPECHLSHSKLSEQISQIESKKSERQIIMTTHSSFVANKMGLDKIILLNDKKTLPLDQLDPSTYEFFRKLPGYDTLRLLLCKKAILVEGDSDELVIQKAYSQKNSGKLPIEDGIDVISVGLSFLRFLEISTSINKPTVVVTDNDGDIEAIKKKYKKYLDPGYSELVKICYDDIVDTGKLPIGDKEFNYNTLEPKFVKSNGFTETCRILGVEYEKIEDLHKYMKENKTDVALKIFTSDEIIKYPQYILDAIS